MNTSIVYPLFLGGLANGVYLNCVDSNMHTKGLYVVYISNENDEQVIIICAFSGYRYQKRFE